MSNQIRHAIDRARYDFSLRLAQEIRRVDGSHDLSASALADALLPFLEASFQQFYPPSPVVMPEDVVEAMAWVDEDIAADERAAEAGRREPHPLLNGQKRARTLARYIRSLSSPAPVEGDVLRKLVEVADTNPFCSVGHFVEHVAPETRARLSRLERVKKGESK